MTRYLLRLLLIVAMVQLLIYTIVAVACLQAAYLQHAAPCIHRDRKVLS